MNHFSKGLMPFSSTNSWTSTLNSGTVKTFLGTIILFVKRSHGDTSKFKTESYLFLMVTQMFPFGNLCQETYLQPQAGMAKGGEFAGFRPPHERIKDLGCPIEPGMTRNANIILRRLRAWLRPGPVNSMWRRGLSERSCSGRI